MSLSRHSLHSWNAFQHVQANNAWEIFLCAQTKPHYICSIYLPDCHYPYWRKLLPLPRFSFRGTVGKKKGKNKNMTEKVFILVLKQRSIIKIVVLEAGFIFFCKSSDNSACSQIGKRMQAINLLLKMKWRESEFPSFFQSQVLRDSLLFVHLCASLSSTTSGFLRHSA